MLLTHTPTGAAAPDFIFCPKLAFGGQHQPAIRAGEPFTCPNPCGAICPLQVGACVTPPPRPTRLTLLLNFTVSHAQLLAPALPLLGVLICRN